MSLEKILHKIQSQINDLAPTLELFIDETIQPSVESCETLQDQLIMLQENIAVYKYKKINNEISPSFNIHAKVSETPVVIEKIPEPETEKIPEPIQDKVQEKIEIEDIKTEVLETENKILELLKIEKEELIYNLNILINTFHILKEENVYSLYNQGSLFT